MDVDQNLKNNGSAVERKQLMKVMNICETFNLLQVTSKPTRDYNTLDLFFANIMALFSDIEVGK